MASLNVDFSDTIGRITPRFFGAGLEHVGANVYGGLWVGPDSPILNTQGWRTDVLDLVQSLRPGVLRWPGGNFAQFYHWRDGIGPIADRPTRFDFFWAKPESNHVGTDEFLALCQLIDAEPSITVNSRTATPAEAADWVEYCNGDGETAGGQRRAANGHHEPYKVRLWAIGSQSWEFGTDDSVRRYRAFARAMKAVDSSIQLIAVGGNPTNHDAWDRAVVKGIEQDLNLLGIWGYDGVSTTDSGHPLDVYYANNAGAERLLWVASNACQVITDEMAGRTDAGVMFDSWGFWRTSKQGLQHDYNLGDALAAATVLNGLIRLAGRARGAAWGNLVNALGLIQATERSCWTTPVYEALRMYRQYHGDEVSRSSVAGPAVDVPGGSTPIRAPRPPQNSLALLDVSATRDRGAGRFTLAVVNRSYDERIDVDLSIWGLPIGTGCTAYTLTGENVTSGNSLALPANVRPYEVVLGLLGTSYSFPARSLTVFVWEETPGLSVASDTTIEEVTSSAVGVTELDEVISPTNQDMVSTLDASGNVPPESSGDADSRELASRDSFSEGSQVHVEGSPSEITRDVPADDGNFVSADEQVSGDVAETSHADSVRISTVDSVNVDSQQSDTDVRADPESTLTSPESTDHSEPILSGASSASSDEDEAVWVRHTETEGHLDIQADPEGALESSDGDKRASAQNIRKDDVATDDKKPNPAAEGVGFVNSGPDAAGSRKDGDPGGSTAERSNDSSQVNFPGPRQPGANNA